MTDSEFRSMVIRIRKQLSDDYIMSASRTIFHKLANMYEYSKADNILIYIDYNGEVSTELIINQAINDHKKIFVPLCKEDYRMDFYCINSIDELIAGHFGILEPIADEKKIFTINDLNNNTLCIVPGTVFDKNYNRMGYGKGYYDRFFERFNINNRIGLAYDFQIKDHIETKNTDIAMTYVITD